jgi:shikimate kinase
MKLWANVNIDGKNSTREVYLAADYDAAIDRLTSDKARLAAEMAENEDKLGDTVNERDALAAELDTLSAKACAAVVVYRTALTKLTDSFKYSTEVVTIARQALEDGQ